MSIFFFNIFMEVFLSLQLLQKEKEQRLGARKDFNEIMSHGFFSEINWSDLDARKIDPPYNPNVVSQSADALRA